MPFDVAGAIKAGYSEQEVLAHLAQKSRFDVAGAKKAGYSDSEILQHLAGSTQAAPTEKAPEPIKIGQEGYGDALSQVLRGTDWGTRNIASAGQSVKNLYEGAKQFITGDVDKNAVAEARAFSKEAPIGGIAGTVAAAAPAMLIPGANTVAGASAIGSVIGLLNPDEEGRAGQVKNALIGAALGAAGQKGGELVARGIGNALARRAAAKEADAVKQATLAAGQALGLATTPSSAGAGLGSRLLEGISGQAKTAQRMMVKNQDVYDDVAREAVGLGKGAPITSDAMQAIRQEAYQRGYEPVAKVGLMATDDIYTKAVEKLAAKYQGPSASFPGAIDDSIVKLLEPFRVKYFDSGDAIQASQWLRNKAGEAFRKGDNGLGKAAKDMARALEDQIERGLEQTGQRGKLLLEQFRDARKLMAKSHTIEDMIVEGSGHIDPRKLASRVQAGKPLEGDLLKAAEFANTFQKVSAVPKGSETIPLSVLDWAAIALGAPVTGGKALILPAARVAARELLSTGPYQRALVHGSDGRNALMELIANNPERFGNALALSGSSFPRQ